MIRSFLHFIYIFSFNVFVSAHPTAVPFQANSFAPEMQGRDAVSIEEILRDITRHYTCPTSSEY